MEMKDIHNFIDMYFEKWNNTYKAQSKEMQAFVIMMKVSEEAGELAREVARSFGFASRKKLERPSKLDSELADVLIYTQLLAKCLGINVEAALKSKMDKIEEKLKNNDYASEGTMEDQMGCGCKG